MRAKCWARGSYQFQIGFVLVLASIASCGGGNGPANNYPTGQCTNVFANDKIASDIKAPAGKMVQIAPALPTDILQPNVNPNPQLWMMVPANKIFDSMMAGSGITPAPSCSPDPSALTMSPGYLKYHDADKTASDVLNPGATRSTLGWYITTNTGDSAYFALFSYDKIVPASGVALCATELFLFGPMKIMVTANPPFMSDPNPPYPPIDAMAINAAGCLLDAVPLALAKVKNLPEPAQDGKNHDDPTEPVIPGIDLDLKASPSPTPSPTKCMLCHSGEPDIPQETVPFPWYK